MTTANSKFIESLSNPESNALELPPNVPSRVVIEGVHPEVDAGRFPLKYTVGERVRVEADIFADGHDHLAGVLRYRHTASGTSNEVFLKPLVNDRWWAEFPLDELGWYEFTLMAWIDWFDTWQHELKLKAEAGQDLTNELQEGAILIREAAAHVGGEEAAWLEQRADHLSHDDKSAAIATGLDPELAERMAVANPRTNAVTYDRTIRVRSERERARFGNWYELFPRSCADEPGRHGTFKDVEKRLDYVDAMGFNVLYLPPVHPIGMAYRKGPNNTLTPGPTDPGSPWAIGSPDGGHMAIHSELGNTDDFKSLVRSANDRGIEIALDIAFQCSPDHPYVTEHPGWFKHRPDGSIKYAENPPKKYQDIYPIDFECDDWQNLWRELRDVVVYWADLGVKIFRVDNPHTKPFRFWEWLIASVQQKHPDTIFLSEAFTRPKVMKHLAKSGFTQSYTYYTWRNTKSEIEEYFTELNQTECAHYMRPNLFANTPDILPELLQYGGPAAFQVRFLLAATLGATYGIYGPPFENFEGAPVAPGKEEYLDSEKYQLRHWDWNPQGPFRELIALVNTIRQENPALHYDHRLRFHVTDNENIVFFSKTTPDLSNIILVVVNLDPVNRQSGWVEVPIEVFGIGPEESYQLDDRLTGARYAWRGARNFVELDPHAVPAHILSLTRHTTSEKDFEFYD